MVIEPAELKPLLQGYPYLLIDRKYKNILDQLPEQVETFDVTIEYRAKKITLNNFIELKVKNAVEREAMDAVPQDGLRIWTFGPYESLFISEALKAEFEKISRADFKFTPGFEGFFFAAWHQNP